MEKEKINFISIDLLLKKIAFKDISDFDFDIVSYLSMQINFILDNDLIIYKIHSLLEYYSHESINKGKIFPQKGFPFGIIDLLNTWILNGYTEKISNNNLIKLKEIYGILSKGINHQQHSKNPCEIEKFINYLDNKINYSKELSDRPISIYKKGSKNIDSTNIINEPILPIKHKSYFDILEWSEIEIARQLSLISHFMMSRIRISELFFTRWTKSDKFTNSPHIMKCIDRFDKLSLWILEEVLSYDKSRLRALVLEKFILIANECLKLNNFNDCFNIVTALNSFVVKRLNKSWSKMKNIKVLQIFFDLNKVCSLKNSLSQLRLETRKVIHKPCVPYLGVYLNLIAFLEEGPKYFKDNLINCDKINKFGNIYKELTQNNKYLYQFKPVFVLSFLAELKPESEDNLIELSKKLEPKFILSMAKLDLKRKSSTDKKSMEMTKTFKKIVIESFKFDSDLKTNTKAMNLRE